MASLLSSRSGTLLSAPARVDLELLRQPLWAGQNATTDEPWPGRFVGQVYGVRCIASLMVVSDSFPPDEGRSLETELRQQWAQFGSNTQELISLWTTCCQYILDLDDTNANEWNGSHGNGRIPGGLDVWSW